MHLALRAVPQGGAKRMPTTRGLSNQFQFRSNVRRFGVVKASNEIGAQQCFGLTWSTPNADDKPRERRQALTLAEPEKTSIAIAS